MSIGRKNLQQANVELSIVIPNYNGARTILNTLNTITHQTRHPSEVIIIDDDSQDNSVELVRNHFPRAKIFQNKTNLGAATARNFGFRNSVGGWILFIDSDVYPQPGCVNSLFRNRFKADIVFPNIFYPNGHLMYPISELQAQYPMISPIFMIRKLAMMHLEGGQFDETYQTYCEDTDFFLRAYLGGLSAYHDQGASAIHDVATKSDKQENRFYLELRNSFYGSIKFFGINRINHFDHAFKFINIAKIFISGIININIFDLPARGYKKYGGFRYNLQFLFGNPEKITKRSRVFLLFLFARALIWNIKNLPRSITARWRFRSFSTLHRKPYYDKTRNK